MSAIPKPVREQDRSYVEWIKTLQCLCRDLSCKGPIDPHHVKPEGGGKMGSKVSDRRCVPLCRWHHMLVESQPAQFIDAFAITIASLNLEYDALHEGREKQAKKPPLKLKVHNCPHCGQVHQVKGAEWRAGSARVDGLRIRFYCSRKGSYIEAEV